MLRAWWSTRNAARFHAPTWPSLPSQFRQPVPLTEQQIAFQDFLDEDDDYWHDQRMRNEVLYHVNSDWHVFQHEDHYDHDHDHDFDHDDW